MKNKHLIIFIIAGILVISSFGFCRNAISDQGVQKVMGDVRSVDWVAGKLVVRIIEKNSFDDIVFVVTRDTVITKLGNTINFLDINLSDKVTVEYCRPDFTGLKALQITVK